MEVLQPEPQPAPSPEPTPTPKEHPLGGGAYWDPEAEKAVVVWDAEAWKASHPTEPTPTSWKKAGFPEYENKYGMPIIPEGAYIKSVIEIPDNPETPESEQSLQVQLGNIAQEQAIQQSKQFYETIGHPELGGKFAPFIIPEGRPIQSITEIQDNPVTPEIESGLQVEFGLTQAEKADVELFGLSQRIASIRAYQLEEQRLLPENPLVITAPKTQQEAVGQFLLLQQKGFTPQEAGELINAAKDIQVSKEFYTTLGYPELGGKYQPFDVPEGMKVTEIKETSPTPYLPEAVLKPGKRLEITLEPTAQAIPKMPSLAEHIAGYATKPLFHIDTKLPNLPGQSAEVHPLEPLAGVIGAGESFYYGMVKLGIAGIKALPNELVYGGKATKELAGIVAAGMPTPPPTLGGALISSVVQLKPSEEVNYLLKHPSYTVGTIVGDVAISLGLGKALEPVTTPLMRKMVNLIKPERNMAYGMVDLPEDIPMSTEPKIPSNTALGTMPSNYLSSVKREVFNVPEFGEALSSEQRAILERALTPKGESMPIDWLGGFKTEPISSTVESELYQRAIGGGKDAMPKNWLSSSMEGITKTPTINEILTPNSFKVSRAQELAWMLADTPKSGLLAVSKGIITSIGPQGASEFLGSGLITEQLLKTSETMLTPMKPLAYETITTKETAITVPILNLPIVAAQKTVLSPRLAIKEYITPATIPQLTQIQNPFTEYKGKRFYGPLPVGVTEEALPLSYPESPITSKILPIEEMKATPSSEQFLTPKETVKLTPNIKGIPDVRSDLLLTPNLTLDLGLQPMQMTEQAQIQIQEQKQIVEQMQQQQTIQAHDIFVPTMGLLPFFPYIGDTDDFKPRRMSFALPRKVGKLSSKKRQYPIWTAKEMFEIDFKTKKRKGELF